MARQGHLHVDCGAIFSMGNNFMMPACNFEPRYRVIMQTREQWTKGLGPPYAVKGFVWYTDGSSGSSTERGTGAGVCGQSLGGRFSISL
jgi:hypothetical protein